MINRRNLLQYLGALPFVGSLIDTVCGAAKPAVASPVVETPPATTTDIYELMQLASYQFHTNAAFQKAIVNTVNRLVVTQNNPSYWALEFLQSKRYMHLLLFGNCMLLKNSQLAEQNRYVDPRAIVISRSKARGLTYHAGPGSTVLPFTARHDGIVHWGIKHRTQADRQSVVSWDWGLPIWLYLTWEEFGRRAEAGEFDDLLRKAANTPLVANGTLQKPQGK